MKDWTLALLRGLAHTAADVLDTMSSEEDEDPESTENGEQKPEAGNEVPEQAGTGSVRSKPDKK